LFQRSDDRQARSDDEIDSNINLPYRSDSPFLLSCPWLKMHIY